MSNYCNAIKDQMDELTEKLRELASNHLGEHGDTAEDCHRVAMLQAIQQLDATINGMTPFDMLALSATDLSTCLGIDAARERFNASRDALIPTKVTVNDTPLLLMIPFGAASQDHPIQEAAAELLERPVALDDIQDVTRLTYHFTRRA